MPKKPTNDVQPRIVILDLATSGFLVAKSVILEVACILVDAASLDVIDANTWLIKHEPGTITGAPDFHADLVELCYTSPDAVSLDRCIGELIAGPWLRPNSVFCNVNPHFDREFMKHHMPGAAQYLPRFEIDLHGIGILAEARGAQQYVSGHGRTYRAGDDAADAYGALVHYGTRLGGTAVAA